MNKKIVVNGILFLSRCVFQGFFAFVSIVPLFWIFISSFKSNKEILESAFSFPSNFGFGGYEAAIRLSPILKFYGNSLIIAFVSTVLNLFVVSMAAYVLSRFDFKGKMGLILLLSSSLLIPTAALLMPIYKIITFLHLYDTKYALILVYAALGLPTSLFVITSYFQTIPKDLEEAAYIDGAGFYKTFFLIIAPLAKPGIATAAILQFLMGWNEFMFALILTKSDIAKTLPLALNYFKSQFSFNYTAMFAAITMAVFPSIVIYVLLQKQVTSSLVAGAVKG